MGYARVELPTIRAGSTRQSAGELMEEGFLLVGRQIGDQEVDVKISLRAGDGPRLPLGRSGRHVQQLRRQRQELLVCIGGCRQSRVRVSHQGLGGTRAHPIGRKHCAQRHPQAVKIHIPVPSDAWGCVPHQHVDLRVPKGCCRWPVSRGAGPRGPSKGRRSPSRQTDQSAGRSSGCGSPASASPPRRRRISCLPAFQALAMIVPAPPAKVRPAPLKLPRQWNTFWSREGNYTLKLVVRRHL